MDLLFGREWNVCRNRNPSFAQVIPTVLSQSNRVSSVDACDRIIKRARCGVNSASRFRATFLLVALLTLLPSCATRAAGARDGWAVAVWPSGKEFSLEIADTDEARARGYMFREKVGPDEGMLFVFDRAAPHGFWMRNCKVSLDIIWLDANFRVAHIAPDVPPCADDEECPSVYPMRPGRYVLEVAGGTAAREGLEVGQRIDVLAEPPIR